MYLKEEDCEKKGSTFKTKLDIALEEIILPFRLPIGLRLMVVFDSWWFDAVLIKSVLDLDYDVSCHLKPNKTVLDNSTSLQVQKYAMQFAKEDFERIEIKVRGKKKSYWALDRLVELKCVSQVKLVLSKKRRNGKPRFYISTDAELSASDSLTIYEDRWNIETNHREANQKIGFKEYILRGRVQSSAIQVVFAIWTLLLLYELEGKIKKKKNIANVREK